MAKLRGLGRGLDALLGASRVGNAVMDDKNQLVEVQLVENQLIELELVNIVSGKYQPRIVFDDKEIEELKNSIMQSGVIEPIIVRQMGASYEIIAGERRFRACKLAELKTIPALIRSITDEEALVIGLIENLQRKDLNIIEEANAYKRLIEEFSLTHEELSRGIGRSRSYITNILRLLNLTPEIHNMLLQEQLDMGHARALLPLPAELQLVLAREVIANSLTTKEVEKKVALFLKDALNDKDQANKSLEKKTKDANIESLQNMLADKMGMAVKIKHNNLGNGRIVINYDSLDELDNLLRYFK
ncbi:MAG: ParB/RepB/Spo0J family partition protein [Bacteroidia bacterium]|nr:MAG: ParB/RepB/Spo0J family partition protein [Bacteroidia bacterium]